MYSSPTTLICNRTSTASRKQEKNFNDKKTRRKEALYLPSGDETHQTHRNVPQQDTSDSDSDDGGICDCPTEECRETHKCPICEPTKNNQSYGLDAIWDHIEIIHEVDVNEDTVSFKHARLRYRQDPGRFLK